MLVNGPKSIYFALWGRKSRWIIRTCEQQVFITILRPGQFWKVFHMRFRFKEAAITHEASMWVEIQCVHLPQVVTVSETGEIWGYSLSATLWPLLGHHLVAFWLKSVLWCRSAALRCDTGGYSALVGLNAVAGTDSYCAFEVATLCLKRLLLMVACFMKYPTRVSIQEQKCSFGVHMYVLHRGAIVLKGVCMIWSIRNGRERLTCLPGICITIPGIHYYLL